MLRQILSASLELMPGDADVLANVRRAEHASRAAARAEIEALYRHHSPSKIGEIDSLIAHYGAAKLLEKVREKYARGRTEAE
mmetsp:Transcript_85169/g.241367  ORF Transcript_85169/g.241367 Transcript_85169/m.241367 type:complete len:82 (-) Transcript_85169:229-474(-)